MIDPRIVEAYEKHSTDLVGYATALVGAHDADDVVSDALVRVIKSVNWDRVVEPRAYLFRCVLHEAVRRGRRHALGRAKESLVEPRRESRVVSGLDELGVFRVLSVRERAVIYLAYWEDLSIGDIAGTLQITDGAVRRYLARARQKLRKELRNV